VILPPEII